MSKSSGGGIGLFELLFVVFLVLKLAGVVDWSWWVVFSPLLIPAAMLFMVLMTWVVGSGLGDWWQTRQNLKAERMEREL